MSWPAAPFFSRASLAISVAALAAATGWWWITFGEVVGYGYLSWREAGRCLVSDNDICSLAKALCLGSHPRSLLAYGSWSFWIAVSLFSLASWLGGFRSDARGERQLK